MRQKWYIVKYQFREEEAQRAYFQTETEAKEFMEHIKRHPDLQGEPRLYWTP